MPCKSSRSIISPPRGRSAAFSLVELLVVIGIIAVLAAILIPVIGKMKQAAYKTDTAAQLNVIRMACEAYHGTFKAYPGIFSEQDIYSHFGIPNGINHGGQNYVTGTENLVLSLMGGIKFRSSGGNLSALEYMKDPDDGGVTTGPYNLNPRNPRHYNVFIEGGEKMLLPKWDEVPNFADAFGNVARDTNVPEFIDRYNEPLPILYLRARVGAPGIIGLNGQYQYDLRQILGYTSTLGANRGLHELGSDFKDSAGESDRKNKELGAFAIPYFKAPGVPMPSGFTATKQDGGTPRAKDTFILISAGQDRIYGTMDDITSFGSLE